MQKPKCYDIPDEFWYPKNSGYKELQVYRLTMSKTCVQQNDFLSLYELHKKQGKIRQDLLDDDRYYGISLYESYEDIEKLFRKVKAKNLKGISKGKTMISDGLVRYTPKNNDSHCTWWLFEHAEPEKYFNSLMEDNSNE